jgi:hypothetical protein
MTSDSALHTARAAKSRMATGRMAARLVACGLTALGLAAGGLAGGSLAAGAAAATTPATLSAPVGIAPARTLMPTANAPAAAAAAVRPAIANRLVLNNALYGVSCTSWKQCMAVGTRAGKVAVAFRPLAELWNGTRWRTVPMPGPVTLTRAQMSEVSCTSGRFCVAIGYHFSPGGKGYAVLAETWNGARWRIIQSRNRSGVKSAFLNAVSCRISGGCIAVGGSAGRSGEGQAIAEQWAHGRWRALPVRSPAGAVATELNGISCGRTFCVAVGLYSVASGQILTLAERWTGKSWQLLKSANARAPLSDLQDVSCNTSSLCMAVGFSDWTRERPMAELWMHGRWRLVAGGGLAGGSLSGISCPGPRRCIAVGFAGSNPLTEAWSGKNWRVLHTPRTSDRPANELNQLSCRTGSARCITVGARYKPGQFVQEATLAEWWNGKSWRVMATRNP